MLPRRYFAACFVGLIAAGFFMRAHDAAAEPGRVDSHGQAGQTRRVESQGSESVIGKPAQPWHAEHWTHSAPLELSQLRGRVVLVRWWTAPDCPFCSATAPSLNSFHERYAARGLSVVGFYHHKADGPLNAADVERYAQMFKFQFPVAIDPDWQTLRAWWLDGGKRSFTSVSFLIDRRGVIRHVHPGGQYVKGDAEYAKMEAQIERLLAEAP
ncbi:MAG TPA: TlpA disulfide reductase family protein [Polyangiales bacterium]|nr:TlpA disulfide reductase family protein [Polyangiales bacterium]